MSKKQVILRFDDLDFKKLEKLADDEGFDAATPFVKSIVKRLLNGKISFSGQTTPGSPSSGRERAPSASTTRKPGRPPRQSDPAALGPVPGAQQLEFVHMEKKYIRVRGMDPDKIPNGIFAHVNTLPYVQKEPVNALSDPETAHKRPGVCLKCQKPPKEGPLMDYFSPPADFRFVICQACIDKLEGKVPEGLPLIPDRKVHTSDGRKIADLPWLVRWNDRGEPVVSETPPPEKVCLYCEKNGREFIPGRDVTNPYLSKSEKFRAHVCQECEKNEGDFSVGLF